LVVIASFLSIALLDGVGYTTGILQNSMVTELGSNKAEIAFSGSLQVGIYSLSGPIVGRLVQDWGNRPVCIIGALLSGIGMLGASFGTSLGSVLVGYSVISGAGFGMMYLPSVTGSAPFFSKRRSLAMAICLCGSGVGTFLMAPITEEILDSHGWRWVMRFLSSLCFLCIFCGLCMFPSPKLAQESEVKEREETTGEKLRARYRFINPILYEHRNFPTFLIVVFADFFAFLSIYIPFSYLPSLAQSSNISSADAAFLISGGGISNMLGRLAGGWLCDFNSLHPLSIILVAITMSCPPSFMLTWVTQYSYMLTNFFFYGICTGCVVGSIGPLLVRLLGVKDFNQTFGFLSAARGLAVLLGPPSAGMVVDYYNDPSMAMFVCGCLVVVSIFLYTLAVIRNTIVTRRQGYQPL